MSLGPDSQPPDDFPALGDEFPQPPDDFLALGREFPQYLIWREPRPEGTRYVARSPRLGLNPYSVVTGDLAELRAALAGNNPPADPA